MLVSAVVAGVVSALIGVPGAAVEDAQDAPPPGSVSVDVVTQAGNGCPTGAPIPVGAPDHSAIGIEWSSAVAPVVTSQPPGVRLNCQTSLHITVPPGYSFGVVADSHRWHATLDAEEVLILRTHQYFSGGEAGTPNTHYLVGPHDDVWETGTGFDAPAMSPCGQPVRLNLTSTTSTIGGTVDLYRIGFNYRLTWTTC